MTSSSDQAVTEHAWRIPAAGLRKLVSSYVGYRQSGVEPARHRGLPSPSVTLIFTLDDPLVLTPRPDPGLAPGSYDSIVGGLHTTPVIITHDGRQSGIQLALSPLGARTLLGVPAGELAGLSVSAEDVLGRLAGEILDRIRGAAGWPERFAILDQALLGKAASAGRRAEACAEVSCAWRRLLRTGGSAPVSALAAETGWSERHLRARFRAETGLAPKAAARVIRFDRAKLELIRRVQANQRLDLAELAAAHGYFDQAHLDREFGSLVGCSPTSWLAEEFRNIRARAA
jgi:AraC-like DNA-binding protein